METTHTDTHPPAATALRQCGLRPTRTRCLILDLLRTSLDHPTASQITARLSTAGDTVSLPTVYQCLDRMVQAGLLSSFVDGDGLMHFDAEPRPHHHLRCIECGVIVDTSLPSRAAELLDALSQAVEDGDTGGSWEITQAKVELQGMCPSCRAHREQPASLRRQVAGNAAKP